MGDQYSFAGSMFRGAGSPEEKRLAAIIWLTDAIRSAMDSEEDVAPALALLSALEGLDSGSVDPMLRLPADRRKGRASKPPAEEGYQAIALAAVECLWAKQGKPKGKLKTIIGSVAEAMAIKDATLAKLREQFTGDSSGERDRLSAMTEAEIIAELERVADLVGKAPRKCHFQG